MATHKNIYLDYAAATPLDKSVLEAMLPYFTDNFYNPSANYLKSLNVKKDLSSARKKVASILGAKEQEIIFTAGATEANNIAIKGVMDQYKDANVVVSSIEHESILEPVKNYNNKKVKVKNDGRIDLFDLEKQIDDKTILVSIMYANNEIGVIQPIHKISQIIEKKKRLRNNNLPIYFHTDAAQAANYLDLHVSRLKVDLMSINGGKIYGPKQSGALYVKSFTILKPLIEGGGQEFNLRSGTENVAFAVGLSQALELAQDIKIDENLRVNRLKDELINLLRNSFKDLEFNGSLKYRLPNNISVTFNNVDNERLIIELDERGIMAAIGSACSASNDEASHVLKAINKSTQEARSTIRFSLGRQTTLNDIKKTAQVLKDLID